MVIGVIVFFELDDLYFGHFGFFFDHAEKHLFEFLVVIRGFNLDVLVVGLHLQTFGSELGQHDAVGHLSDHIDVSVQGNPDHVGKNVRGGQNEVQHLGILRIELDDLGESFLPAPERSALGSFLVLRERVLHLSDHVVEDVLEDFPRLQHAFFEALFLD